MAKQANMPASSQINMIGEGTVFEGTLRAESDVRISGRIIGKVQVDGKVIIAQEGAIEGEIHARSLDVAGDVQGDLYVAERLVLKTSARIEGNIKSGRLIVEEGALFSGKCQVGEHRPFESEGLGQNGTAARAEGTPAPASPAERQAERGAEA